ncbi:MAG TPA: hypothetical protein VJU84_13780 [Pyrinomonadaceae bacterium]|nr:hypothetical protein [Pyrinomonadaceae bacterium]
MKFLSISTLLLLAVGAAYSQSAAPSKSAPAAQEMERICPTISVSCPNDPKANEPIRFTGNVTGGIPRAEPLYYWTISHGEIIEGQGTLVIAVKAADPQTLTGTLTVFGYNKRCGNTASCSTPTICPPIPPKKFDSYGQLRTQERNLRLDQFLAALNNNPGAQGYILGYRGPSSPAGASEKAIAEAREYLISVGIENGRIVTVDSGLDEEFKVELWVVPAGSVPPAAHPPDPVLGGRSSTPEKP